MDAKWVVVGVLQLVLSIAWIALLRADGPRPPEERRHFKSEPAGPRPHLGCAGWSLGVLAWPRAA
jgi:hypothetical protein